MGGEIITPTIGARRINLEGATVGMVVATAKAGETVRMVVATATMGGNSWNSGNSGGGGGKQRPNNIKLYNNNN